MEHIHKVIIVLLILALIFAVAAVTMASTFFDFKTWSFKERQNMGGGGGGVTQVVESTEQPGIP